MTTLRSEFIRLHGIHRVLHEALPIMKACPDVVEVWAENTHRDSWEARFGHKNGSSCYRAGTEKEFIEHLNGGQHGHDWFCCAKSHPGAVHFWRPAVLEEFPLLLRDLREALALAPGHNAAWITEDSAVIHTSSESTADCVAHKVDRRALERGLWLPREFLVFGDEPAPVPFEQDILSNGWTCDACGGTGRCLSGSVRPIAGIHYASCSCCAIFTNEAFITNARNARARPAHRPDTGRPRQVARFDTEKGEVVFVDGVRQAEAGAPRLESASFNGITFPTSSSNLKPADSAGRDEAARCLGA